MIKVDLITGYLGAGKTTFLKKYAKYFIERGKKVGILENDYGAVNVDMLLLNELRGDKCELEMVAGACDDDCHKRRFKTKLISMGMSGYDRVIIEPSGVFDVDEFFDSLREEPLEHWYEIGNVIAIVDSKTEDNLSDYSQYFLASQVAKAGAIVLSKTRFLKEDEINNKKEMIKRIAINAGVQKKLTPFIMGKNWDDFTTDDWDRLANCSYRGNDLVKKHTVGNSGYSSVYFLDNTNVKVNLTEKIKTLFADDSFGNVFRIKGFFEENNQWHQVNATKEEVLISDIPVGQEVMIVIGEGLNEDKIRNYMDTTNV
ncbi:MAG: GTPase (G3E family) [Lachnospiraceae bacterium]|nr:GTPase (G3E family) [Lachnospiraceae bacterium]